MIAGLLLVDGDCLLCHRSLRWLLQRRRHDAALWYAPAPVHGSGAVMFVGIHGAWRGSAAVLHACRCLHWPWPLAAALLLVPAPLREGAYRGLSLIRFHWFGRCRACIIGDPRLQKRRWPHPLRKRMLLQGPWR